MGVSAGSRWKRGIPQPGQALRIIDCADTEGRFAAAAEIVERSDGGVAEPANRRQHQIQQGHFPALAACNIEVDSDCGQLGIREEKSFLPFSGEPSAGGNVYSIITEGEAVFSLPKRFDWPTTTLLV